MSPGEGPVRGRRKAARSEEPQEIGSVLEGLLGQRPWASGVSLGALGRQWESVVGERLAQETSPVRLESGVLLVKASTTAWAAQVRFLVHEVRERANQVLGSASIRDVKVTIDPGPVSP